MHAVVPIFLLTRAYSVELVDVVISLLVAVFYSEIYFRNALSNFLVIAHCPMEINPSGIL